MPTKKGLLESLALKQLRQLATENNIKLDRRARRKEDIIEILLKSPRIIEKKISAIIEPTPKENGDKNENNEHKIQALLKEWRLCQDNANASVSWSWQIGALFIGLSLAAIWIQFQIEVPNRFAYSVVLAIFSIVTIVIWDATIAMRAGFYIRLSYIRAHALEYEIGKLCYGDPKGNFKTPCTHNETMILHTFIHSEDNKQRGLSKLTKSKYGMIFFNLLVMSTWIAIIYLNSLLLAIDP